MGLKLPSANFILQFHHIAESSPNNASRLFHIDLPQLSSSQSEAEYKIQDIVNIVNVSVMSSSRITSVRATSLHQRIHGAVLP
jgi:hypothetical protein